MQQLRFGVHALGDFLGQLRGGVIQSRQMRALAVAVFGDVLDEHQAQLWGAIRRNLPLRLANLALHAHVQRAFPAFAVDQTQTQFIEDRALIFGEAFTQRLLIAVIDDQLGECVIALMHFQIGIEHGDRRRDVGEDLAETRLAFAQGIFRVAHPQQGTQRRQEHIGVDRVNQIGIGARVEAGDDVAGLDRRR